jgi:hypothetical protein
MAFWIALGVSVLLALLLPFSVATSRQGWGRGYNYGTPWHYAWWGAVVMAMFMFIGGIMATAARTNPSHYNKVATVKLQALKTTSSLEGRFFLASGTVDDEVEYAWLAKDENGFITRHSVEARYAYIIEDGETATLEYRYQCNTWTFPWETCMSPAYVFTVPTGSVLNEFEVTP